MLDTDAPARWFGREPALWIQTLGTTLALAVGLGAPGLDDALAAALMGVAYAVAGVWTAWHVRPMAPTIWTSLIIAVAGVLAQLGFDLGQQKIALLTAAAASVMTLILRQQITPAHDPRPGAGVVIDGEVVR